MVFTMFTMFTFLFLFVSWFWTYLFPNSSPNQTIILRIFLVFGLFYYFKMEMEQKIHLLLFVKLRFEIILRVQFVNSFFNLDNFMVFSNSDIQKECFEIIFPIISLIVLCVSFKMIS
jgi:hypothetical protein